MAVSNLLKSKVLIVVLLLGNVTLGLTTMEQGRIIQGQKNLIHLLFQDSAELASFKIAANLASNAAKKH
jgi:hypothetical protein